MNFEEENEMIWGKRRVGDVRVKGERDIGVDMEKRELRLLRLVIQIGSLWQ